MSFNFGYLPHETVMKSVELLGTFVIPELAKRSASHAASVLTDGMVKAEETIRERETTLSTYID